MHYLEETHILLFIIQVLLLLGLARGLGLLFERVGQPAITAEILVGVLLGPTVFGRALPGLQQTLFPPDAIQQAMLDAVAWLGILFFLLTTGLDTEFSNAWRQRRNALYIAASDLVIPMAIAFVPSLLLPAAYLASPGERVIFALFIATIMTISALPVTARALQDLDIYRTDVGLLIMGALTINDIVGWLVFALILGFVAHGEFELSRAAFVLAGTVGFAALALSLGRWLANRAIQEFQRLRLPEPGVSLTFISVLGLFFGAVTMGIGIHALFGFFIAGLVAGESRALSQQARQTMAQMVRAILVPIFFATIGLRIDFAARFDLVIVVFLVVLGVAGRYAGAWVGVVLSRQPHANRVLISVAHTPGGEMQIVIGILALEYAVITETVFVGVVASAIISSMILGPWMKHALGVSRKGSIFEFASRSAVAADIDARTREDAIRQLSIVAARQLSVANTRLHRAPDAAAVADSVIERERARSTALSEGVAVPHARLAGISRGVVVAANSRQGIDWDAPDGRHARVIFLIVTPEERDDQQIRILRAIALAMVDREHRDTIAAAENDRDLWTAVQRAFWSPSSPTRRRPS